MLCKAPSSCAAIGQDLHDLHVACCVSVWECCSCTERWHQTTAELAAEPHLNCCCGWNRLPMTAAPGSMLLCGRVGGCPSCAVSCACEQQVRPDVQLNKWNSHPIGQAGNTYGDMKHHLHLPRSSASYGCEIGAAHHLLVAGVALVLLVPCGNRAPQAGAAAAQHANCQRQRQVDDHEGGRHPCHVYERP